MGYVAAVVAVVAAAASTYSSEKSRKEQKKARKAQERIRQTQSARQRLSEVREARIRQSQVLQGAANMEGSSSTTQGAYSSLGSTAAGNMQFINQMDSLQQEVYRRMEKANLYGAQAGYYSTISNMASSMSGGSMGAPTQSTAPTQAGSMSNAGSNSSSVVNSSQPWTNPLPPSTF